MANANLIFNRSLTAHRSKMRMKERRAASEIKLSFLLKNEDERAQSSIRNQALVFSRKIASEWRMKMEEQKIMYDSGNELAAYAAKQINYHVMGYYPITPSTQIAENLDIMRAEGKHDILLIAAEGEHSAAGICYGASAGGGRVFNATSANGLLYALEQFPVQSGTRMPMVMNIACRTISGPLCIKGDHSDVMYMLNTGWIILFADEPQKVYDFNLLALKLAELVRLPVAVAFDGFFTSHQKRKCLVFADDEVVSRYIGPKLSSDNPNTSAFAKECSTGENCFASVLDLEHPVSIGSYMNEPDVTNNRYQLHLAMEEARKKLPGLFDEYKESVLDLEHPVSIGSYMNEPDVTNNRYQLHLAMEEARKKLPGLFDEYKELSGRTLSFLGSYQANDAEILLFVLGSSYYTAMEAVDTLRREGIKAGVITLYVLRPFPAKELTMQKSFSLCLARPTTLRWRLSIRSAAKGSRQASSRSMCCARSRLRSCASSARMQRPSLSPTVRTATAQAAEI